MCHHLDGSFWKQSIYEALDQQHLSQPKPNSYLREVETTFCNERVHHSVHNGDHDDNQDGIHRLQRKWRGAFNATTGNTWALESELSLSPTCIWSG